MDLIQYIYITTGVMIYIKLCEISKNQTVYNSKFERLYNKMYYGV